MFPRRRIGGSQHSRVGSNRSLRMLDPEAPVSPPSARHFALEARGLFSIGALLAAGPLLASARRGEPQAVIVLPGLNTTDRSTVAIRCYLRVLGYQTSGWKLGRNDRPAGVDLPAVAAQIRSLHASSGTPVSVVGLSRGGIIAREATRMAPNSVRLVITMGSPFAAPAATNVVAGWRLVTGEGLMAQSPEGLRRLADPLPVPSTSIYSRSDGNRSLASVPSGGRAIQRKCGSAGPAHRPRLQSGGVLGHRRPAGAASRPMDAVSSERSRREVLARRPVRRLTRRLDRAPPPAAHARGFRGYDFPREVEWPGSLCAAGAGRAAASFAGS